MFSFKHFHSQKTLPSFQLAEDHYDFTDDEIKQAEHEADAVEWHDIIDFYDDDELDFSDLTDQDWEPQHGEHDDHPDNQHINEELSAQQRNQKRLAFARTKQRRRMSMKIALHRQSNPAKLQKRSKSMARRILMKKILRGRSKDTLSAQEKNRLEMQLKNAGPILTRIAQRMMPKIRQIEQVRIHHKAKPKKQKTYKLRESLGLPPEAFNNEEGPITVPTPEARKDAKSRVQLYYKVRAQTKNRTK